MAEEEITVKDLAEWENDFQDELSNCFWGTDVEIQFVSEELLMGSSKTWNQ